jgi:hypothetical protein
MNTNKQYLHKHIDKVTTDLICSAVHGLEDLDDNKLIATVSGYQGNHAKKHVLISDINGYLYRLTIESRLSKELLK